MKFNKKLIILGMITILNLSFVACNSSEVRLYKEVKVMEEMNKLEERYKNGEFSDTYDYKCPDCNYSGDCPNGCTNNCYNGCIHKINCKNCGKVTFTEYSCNYKCDRCKEYKKKYNKELGDLWKFNHTDRMLSGYCFDCGYKIRNSEDGKIWTIDEYLNDNGRSLEEENQEKSEDAEVNPYHEPKDIKIDNNGIWDYEPPMTIEYDNDSDPYYIPNY